MHNLVGTTAKFDPWVWIAPVAGIFLVIVSPTGSAGWMLLNFTLLQLFFLLMIIPHELGHAFAARLMGMKVIKIIIGRGRILFTLHMLGLLWEIKRFPSAGFTLFSGISTRFYRSRLFLIILFGPFTNFLLILFARQIPQTLFLQNIPGTHLYPGAVFYVANFLMIVINLWPQQVKNDEENVSSDGLQMLAAPFLSKQEIHRRVALGYCLDGQEWERRGNHEKAIERFNQAIQKDPACIQAYQSRVMTYQSISNYQAALEDCDQVIRLMPQNALSYFSRGLTYYSWSKLDSSKLQKAIADFDHAIELDSNVESFYYIRAVAYSYLGDENRAIADFTKVIQLNPSTNAYYNRGVVYAQSSNWHLALEDLNQAIEIDSNNVSAYYSRGNAKCALKDKSGALQDYQTAKALEVAGKWVNAQDEHGFYARGIAYAHLEHWEPARQSFQMAETLCLEHGNSRLLQQTRDQIKAVRDASGSQS